MRMPCDRCRFVRPRQLDRDFQITAPYNQPAGRLECVMRTMLRWLLLVSAVISLQAVSTDSARAVSAAVAGRAVDAPWSVVPITYLGSGYDRYDDDADDEEDIPAPVGAYGYGYDRPPPPPSGYGPYGYGYRPPAPTGYFTPPVVEWLPPPRPSSCGEYRYWDGERCADARWQPPYVGPRW